MKNKRLIKMIAVGCILLILVINLCKMLASNSFSKVEAKVDLSAVEKINNADVGTVMKSIRKENPGTKFESIEASGTEADLNEYTPEEVLQKIQSGEASLSGIFSETLIAGDSLVEALAVYNIINSENVMAKVSASLSVLQSISGQIISNYPKTLVLHYGLNHVGGSSQVYVDNYISAYTKIIENFKENLPDTRIVVSGIFMPSEHGLAVSPYLKAVPQFNEGLEKMCQDLEVEFLDNSSIIPADGSSYEPDGIHMKKSFYTDYWLPYIASELNLL